jgi:hypothetical protein
MKYLKSKWTVLVILLLTSPLAIGGFCLNSITYPLLWIYIPFVIYKILPNKKSRLKTILITISFICYIFICLLPILRFVMCGYGQSNYKYVSKKNPNVKLVGRDFGCYGTTEDLVLYKEYSISKYIKIETHYKTFIDYKNISIDSSEWRKIEKN